MTDLRHTASPLVLAVALIAMVALSGCHRPSPLPVLSQIQPHTLTAADGQPFPLASLKGDVWVAHFMFTRCGGPCPRMVAEFGALQRAIGPLEGLHWVSISADPTYDTPEVLTAYAADYDADPARWHFLTGDVETIYELAEKSFLLPVEPSSKEGGLITHSLKLAVVDHQGQIRAYHDHFDPQNETLLTEEIEGLLKEAP